MQVMQVFPFGYVVYVLMLPFTTTIVLVVLLGYFTKLYSPPSEGATNPKPYYVGFMFCIPKSVFGMNLDAPIWLLV